MPSRTDISPDHDRGHSFGQRHQSMQPQPLTPTDARQGAYGRPVLIVLLGGLLLAMIFWIPAEWWGNSIAPDNPANQPPAATAPSPAENAPGTTMPGDTSPSAAPERP